MLGEKLRFCGVGRCARAHIYQRIEEPRPHCRLNPRVLGRGIGSRIRRPRDAVMPEDTHARGVRAITCRDHTAFARRDVLDRMETECCQIGERPDGSASVGSTERVTGVGHERHAMSRSHAPQTIPVARLPGEVDADDRACSWTDPPLDLGWREEQRGRIDVAHHRIAARIIALAVCLLALCAFHPGASFEKACEYRRTSGHYTEVA